MHLALRPLLMRLTTTTIIMAVIVISAVKADERACCYSDTFTMNGRLLLNFNNTELIESGVKQTEFAAEIDCTVTTKADFNSRKFAAQLQCSGWVIEDDDGDAMYAQANLTAILDANRSTPLLYMETNYVLGPNISHSSCYQRQILNTPRIDKYKCVPQQVFRGGTVKDGRMEMLAPDDLPYVISDHLRIYFDEETCTPALMTYDFDVLENVYVKFRFEADSKLEIKEMPVIPENLRQCVQQGAASVTEAGQVNDLVSMGVIMAGIM